MKNEFLKRLETTTFGDMFFGKKFKESVLETLTINRSGQPDDAFRRLLREILENEAGITGQEEWKTRN
ncbi:MAG: hypothetical protein WC784_03390 [Candidatus Shapirobacteria bacterium]|jgi:hypothetical protein